MYSLTIAVDDYDFDDPQEAAEAMLHWLRDDRTVVFVSARNIETGERTLVEVEAPKE